MDSLLPPDPPRAIRDLDFAVIDLETNGGTPKARWDKHDRFQAAGEITELGLVRMSGAVLQDRYQSLAAIEGALPLSIQKLTGITPAMLVDAPSWERVALQVGPLLEGRVWVAHHAPFDGSFLKAHLPEGIWGRHRLVCTRLLAKKLVPEVQQRGLANLCAFFGIVNQRHHRALQDAEATAELLQRLMERGEAAGLDAEAFLKLGDVDWKKL